MLSFPVKFVQTDRQTDRRMDGQTMVKQYAPDLSIRGHKNIFNCKSNSVFSANENPLIKSILTLYHTIITFNNPIGFENIVGKGAITSSNPKLCCRRFIFH